MEEQKQVKVTMSAVRLTGEQSRRLMELARTEDGTDEAQNWADTTLEQYGLVVTIDIPFKTQARFDQLVAKQWAIIQRMAKKKTLTEAEIGIVDGAAGQMRDTVSYRMKKKYTAITKAGRELAAKGKVMAGKR